MSFKYNKLRGRIVEICGTQAEFAKKINLTEQSLTAKLAGRIKFSQDEILRWCEVLDIDLNEIGVYFFTTELQKTEV